MCDSSFKDETRLQSCDEKEKLNPKFFMKRDPNVIDEKYEDVDVKEQKFEEFLVKEEPLDIDMHQVEDKKGKLYKEEKDFEHGNSKAGCRTLTKEFMPEESCLSNEFASNYPNANNRAGVASFQGLTNRSKLFIDCEDHIFMSNRKLANGSLLVRCRETCCPARGTIANMNIETRGDHNHSPDYSYITTCRFLSTLKERVKREETSFRVIYDEEALRYPGVSLPAFSTLESTMYKHRHSMRPPLPQTMEDCVAAATEDRFRIDGRQLFSASVEDANGRKSLLFVAAGERRARLTHAGTIYLDATFRGLPPLFKQLLTIHTTVKDETFAAAYILMQDQTEEAYTAAFRGLKRALPKFNPGMALSDFEPGLRAGLERVFPEISLLGCWFHFTQTVWRKVEAFGLFHGFHEHESVNGLVRSLMALPLLPPNKMEKGIQCIHGDLETAPHHLLSDLRRLLEYVRDSLVRHILPDNLSVFRNRRMTTTSVESFSAELGHKFATINTNFFAFLQKLVSIEKGEEASLQRLLTGQRIKRRRRRSSTRRENVIREASQMLCDGELSVEEFLRRTRTCLPETDFTMLPPSLLRSSSPPPPSQPLPHIPDPPAPSHAVANVERGLKRRRTEAPPASDTPSVFSSDPSRAPVHQHGE